MTWDLPPGGLDEKRPSRASEGRAPLRARQGLGKSPRWLKGTLHQPQRMGLRTDLTHLGSSRDTALLTPEVGMRVTPAASGAPCGHHPASIRHAKCIANSDFQHRSCTALLGLPEQRTTSWQA